MGIGWYLGSFSLDALNTFQWGGRLGLAKIASWRFSWCLPGKRGIFYGYISLKEGRSGVDGME